MQKKNKTKLNILVPCLSFCWQHYLCPPAIIAGKVDWRVNIFRVWAWCAQKIYFWTKMAHGAMRSINIQMDVRALTDTGLMCTCLEGPCKVFVNKDRGTVKRDYSIFYGYEIFFFWGVLYERSAVKHLQNQPSLTFEWHFTLIRYNVCIHEGCILVI